MVAHRLVVFSMVQCIVKSGKRYQRKLNSGNGFATLPMAANECRHNGVPEVLSGFPATVLTRRSDAIVVQTVFKEYGPLKGGPPAVVTGVTQPWLSKLLSGACEEEGFGITTA